MTRKTSTLWSRTLSGIALMIAVTLVGCNEPDAPTASSPSETTEALDGENAETLTEPSLVAETPEPSASSESEAVSSDSEDAGDSRLPNTTVSEQGLGVATLGMTLGDLKEALPDFEFVAESPFIVDFDAVAVRQGEETFFYILHLADSPLADSDRIQGLITDHPIFRTAEDVGVGTPLNAAEIPYGKAVLSYNTGNESREYVRLENHPATNISFGTQKQVIAQDESSSGLAGIYDTTTSQYNETDVYQAEAAIEAILIVCLSASCSE